MSPIIKTCFGFKDNSMFLIAFFGSRRLKPTFPTAYQGRSVSFFSSVVRCNLLSTGCADHLYWSAVVGGMTIAGSTVGVFSAVYTSYTYHTD